ncbi:MAG: hypothetical protein KatS3mg082_0901 [Nitrospiraceae bacterium]|nr:MAG: hypothetical protein KatS3mg082_0901 [Nitrospiraceae bacterium]
MRGMLNRGLAAGCVAVVVSMGGVGAGMESRGNGQRDRVGETGHGRTLAAGA